MPSNGKANNVGTPHAVGQAQAGSDLLQLVSFRLGGEEFGLEILKVQEIIRMPDMTRVPNAPEFVEGVINLRGRVIPVIGLRKRFGLESRDHGKDTRIVVVEVLGSIVGFEVDSVSEVLRIPADTVEPPPRLAKMKNEYVSGVGKLENRLLLLLDIDRLITETEQGQIHHLSGAGVEPSMQSALA